MRRFLLAFLLLAGGCYDSSFGEAEERTASDPATTTIAELARLFTGESVVVTGDIVVEGRVTATDRSGNFYRSLCIGDGASGLEFMAGLDHLHNDYPIGCRVTLRLRGLAVGRHYGVLQVGRAPTPGSGYPTAYLGSPAAVEAALSRSGGLQAAPVAPLICTIDDLDPGICGALVRIEGLRYAPEGVAQGAWAGYKRFCDARGAVVYSYVRAGADFADEEVPAGICSLTGILQYDAPNRFIIKLRDASDCAH